MHAEVECICAHSNKSVTATNAKYTVISVSKVDRSLFIPQFISECNSEKITKICHNWPNLSQKQNVVQFFETRCIMDTPQLTEQSIWL